MPTPAPLPPARLRTAAMVLLVFGAALACYWPALHGKILWDDPAHIPRPELRSLAGLRDIWLNLGVTQQYYPVLFSAFWLEHQLWGDAMLGYHLVNVLWHTLSCCLLALILRRLWTPAANAPAAPPVPAGAAWFAALLFAVHPICVESVAWVTEQKNTLSLLFYLLAAWSYLRFTERRDGRSYALASVLFVLALGAKTATVGLPAALLVVGWWRAGRIEWRRDVVPLLPWFGFAGAYGLLTSWFERKVIGAEEVGFDFGFVDRALLAARSTWFYVAQLAWPGDLNFFYPRWDIAADSRGWWGYLAAALAVTIGAWLVRGRTRGPLAAWLLFLGALFPVLGFFKVFFFYFSYVNDHFAYLASVMAIAAVAGAAGLAWQRAPAAGRATLGATGAAVLALFAFWSHRQSALYVDNVTLFRATIAKNPDSWMAHHILGFALAKDPANSAEAAQEYRAALRLNPAYPDAHHGLAIELAKAPATRAEAIAHYERALALRPGFPEAHYNLANTLALLPGRTADALAHYETALTARPTFAEAHNKLGALLLTQPGRLAEAVTHLEEALRLRPDFSDARLNLANALAATPGRTDAALAEYARILADQPDSAVAHFNLANTLARLPGRLPEAVPHYEAVLQLKPDSAEAHANLGNALLALGGREADALAHYELALQLDPNLASVHLNLAQFLARVPGRQAEAVAHAEAAVRLNPRDVEAYNGLAILYAQFGRLDDAQAQWEAALRIDPGYAVARQNLQLLARLRAGAARP